MERSQNSELVHRINHTFLLIKKGLPKSEIVKVLQTTFGISSMQAYRYFYQAEKQQQVLPIPEKKHVFTVKLPISLIQQTRQFSKRKHLSISEIVELPLIAFVGKQKND